MLIEEIREALRQTHPADIHTIKKYVAWVKFRRRMHSEFYLIAPWVDRVSPGLLEQSGVKAHWIGV